jgi:hypothetical protein
VLDKDGDGSLSRAEAAANPELARQFDAADKNGDGKLSRMEYLAVMARKDLNIVRERLSGLLAGERRSDAPASRDGEPARNSSAGTSTR